MTITNLIPALKVNHPGTTTTWFGAGSSTVVEGVATAPDGTTTAFSVQDTDGAASSYIAYPYTVPADTATHSACVFVEKKLSAPGYLTGVGVTFGDGFSPSRYYGVQVDASAGVASLIAGWFTPSDYGVIDWDDDYWMLWVQAPNNSETQVCIRIMPCITAAGAGGGIATFWTPILAVGAVHPELLAAAFSVDSKFGIAPYTATLSDESTGDPSAWLWDFGDGSTSTNQNPTHTYTLTGYYPVTLTVTGQFGTSVLEKDYYIIVRAAVTAFPRIAWDNALASDDATLSASSEASGYEKENAVDWRPYTWWKPTASGVSWLNGHFSNAVPATCIAIYAHTLGAVGATVKAQFSVDGGTTYYDATPSIAPAGTEAIYLVFPYCARADWRLYIDAASAAPVVGCVFIGVDMTVERGTRPSSPALFNRDNVITNTVSQNGIWLGRSLISRGWMANIALDFLTESFVRDEWMPFVEHAEVKPWFLLWDEANRYTEAAWCFADGAIPGPQYTSATLMNAGIKAKARIE